jgi:exodeoxyribonuclease VII small subunit
MVKSKKQTDFAGTLAQLETLIARLEDENTSLERSLTDFEQGITLVKEAQKALVTAEQKVNTLIETDGDPTVEPFQKNEDEQ